MKILANGTAGNRQDGGSDGATVEFRLEGVVVSVSLDNGQRLMSQAAAVARAKEAISRLAKLDAPLGSSKPPLGTRPSVFDAWAYRVD